jgi:hypothetical protein
VEDSLGIGGADMHFSDVLGGQRLRCGAIVLACGGRIESWDGGNTNVWYIPMPPRTPA